MGKVLRMAWGLKSVILALLLSLFCSHVSAQNSTSDGVRKQVFNVASKYENAKGVLAMTCEDGVKMQTVKMILRKQFNSEFANSVKAFAIVIYKDAPSETINQIVGDVGQIITPLQEIDIKDKMKNGEVARGYIRLSEDKTKITDLIIVVQAPSPKLIYICGEFDIETARMMI